MSIDGARTADDLDGPASSRCYWSTVNANEMLPGVCTPLTWSWFRDHNELSMRRAFHALGLLAGAEVPLPRDVDRRFTGVFHGRATVNVDMFRELGDRTPGTSGDAVEQQFFGRVREGVAGSQSRRRYPVVAVRFPYLMLTGLPRLRSEVAPTLSWWQRSVRRLETADLDTAITLLDDAYRRYPAVFTRHLACTMLTQSLFDRLSRLASEAGLAGSEGTLTTGAGGLEETAALHRVWTAARGRDQASSDQDSSDQDSRRQLAPIIAEHGFLGPGELSQPSWREDDRQLRALLTHYRGLPADAGPDAVARRQRAARQAAQAALLAALPRLQRPPARLLLGLTDRFMPSRETGRSLMLMPLDVARAASRTIGTHLAARGTLQRGDDVFFLTVPELLAARTAPVGATLADRVRERRARRLDYLAVELPEAWQGTPRTHRVPARSEPVELVEGLGVGPGVVEGPVRVVGCPDDGFEDGEVLVCRSTDPSWTALFARAAAVVVDIGGAMSHGAIVSRELGLPCVVGTRDGTRRLRDGDRVRVDGTAGTITRLTGTPERIEVHERQERRTT